MPEPVSLPRSNRPTGLCSFPIHSPAVVSVLPSARPPVPAVPLPSTRHRAVPPLCFLPPSGSISSVRPPPPPPPPRFSTPDASLLPAPASPLLELGAASSATVDPDVLGRRLAAPPSQD